MNNSANALPALSHLEQGDLPDLAGELMSVGLRLFAQKGYTATSVREIVQTADATNPMLYYYFNSKEGLYRKLVESLFESIRVQVLDALDGASTFREKIYAVAWTQLEAAQKSPVALQFIYGVLFGPPESRPEIDIYELHVELIGTLTCVMENAIDDGQIEPRPGVDALFLTQQLLGMINNHMTRALTLIQSLDDPELESRYLDEILSPEECRRLVEFFLAGANHTSNQRTEVT